MLKAPCDVTDTSLAQLPFMAKREVVNWKVVIVVIKLGKLILGSTSIFMKKDSCLNLHIYFLPHSKKKKNTSSEH